ncbi:hypothetical protein LX64_01414 [Chitinophaga skermanii]|uniref:Natural product n=1 Tax=Chitinophaga skermanii TaxID=331697 RepID=A0A327QWM6_9BACT|nr:hypothetical protein LX64_01414 [Chitinophaga skermanii]
MKKRKLQLSKLSFEKTVVALLSTQDQAKLQGGTLVTITDCHTWMQSCETVPVTDMYCKICLDPLTKTL